MAYVRFPTFRNSALTSLEGAHGRSANTGRARGITGPKRVVELLALQLAMWLLKPRQRDLPSSTISDVVAEEEPGARLTGVSRAGVRPCPSVPNLPLPLPVPTSQLPYWSGFRARQQLSVSRKGLQSPLQSYPPGALALVLDVTDIEAKSCVANGADLLDADSGLYGGSVENPDGLSRLPHAEMAAGLGARLVASADDSGWANG